jgi:hypothetical protein
MAKNFRHAISIAAALLAAGGATASDEPLQCTTNGGGWTVTATQPFDAATCPVADCTGMTYTITPLRGEIPDHVAITVEHDTPIVIPPSTFDTAPCAGDLVSGLAFRDCSKQTARINQNQQKVGPFDLVVQGVVKSEGGSIVVKKGKVAEQCRIATLGLPYDVFDPHQQVATQQTYQFKQCSLTIQVDPVTGAPGDGVLSGAGCKFVANNAPVGSVALTIGGVPLGNSTFISDGDQANGANSCSTRTISGRVYSFCDCTSLTDPRPPCS